MDELDLDAFVDYHIVFRDDFFLNFFTQYRGYSALEEDFIHEAGLPLYVMAVTWLYMSIHLGINQLFSHLSKKLYILLFL